MHSNCKGSTLRHIILIIQEILWCFTQDIHVSLLNVEQRIATSQRIPSKTREWFEQGMKTHPEPIVSHGWKSYSSSIAQSPAGPLLVEDTQGLRQPSKLWLASSFCRAAAQALKHQPWWNTRRWGSCPAEPFSAGVLPLRFCNLSSCVKKAWLCKARNLPEDSKLSPLLMLKAQEDFFGRKMKHCKSFSSKAFKVIQLFN